MNTFDFILPASRNASAHEAEPLIAPAAKKSAEPFDSLMRRALNKPAHSADDHNALAKKSGRETRPTESAKAEPVAPRKAKATSRPAAAADKPTVTANTSDPTPAVTVKAKDEQPEPSSTATSVTDQDVAAAASEAANAAAMQTLAASAGLPALVTPDIAKNSSSTGSSTTGSSPATVAAIGTGALASGPEVVEKNPEPTGKERAAQGKEMPAAPVDSAKDSTSSDGAIPIQELLDKATMVQETPATIDHSAEAKPHTLTVEPTGTSAAEHPSKMNKAEHAAKVAETPENSLPGVSVSGALPNTAPAKPAPRAAAKVESAEAPTANFAQAERPPTLSETSSSSMISASSQTELRTRALDRTHDMLALHGLQLRQSGNNSMQVVIKPGAGVQLSLQLKQTSDGIEAQAMLQSGDFKQLNQHWTELQQRLVERGIKLAPLGQEGAAMNSGGENFQRPSQQSSEQNSLSAGAFAEFASAGATVARPVLAVAGEPSRGWEGWA